MATNDALQDDRQRDPEVVTTGALLTKEMEETNHWARLGAQLYFGWFTLLLTVNGFAIGWLFTSKVATPQLFARVVFCAFVVLDVLGTIATFRIRQHLFDSDRRIKEVIKKLTQHRVIEGTSPQSPVPLGAIKTALGFTGIALIVLALFWSILVIFAHRLADG
jgi:hypothetical protein